MPTPTPHIAINRAPVLTLWAAVVAERLGCDRAEALTLGRALAGLNAQSKGRRLRILAPAPAAKTEARAQKRREAGATSVELMGRTIPVIKSRDGLRALKDTTPDSPESVERYLEGKFGDALASARTAMMTLARSRTPAKLAEEAFGLYEKFRPAVPEGQRGWGARGELDLAVVLGLARKPRGTRGSA